MTQAQTIGLHALATHLTVSTSAVRRWEHSGYITVIEGDVRRYLVAEINERLAEGARNFSVAPTLADIIEGRLLLVKPDEAATMMRLAVEGVYASQSRGRIRAIQLAHEFRYDKASIDEYLAARNDEQFPSWEVLRHICGLTEHVVERMVRTDRLVDASTSRSRRVTGESLIRFLREQLPDWIDPYDWLDDRSASDRPLLYAAQMVLTVGDIPRIRILTEDRELRYIRTPTTGPSKNRLISPDSWLAYIERTEEPAFAADIAMMFDVEAVTVARWRKRHEECLRCEVHAHPDSTLYYTCLMFLLKRYLSPGASPTQWHRSRMSGVPLVSAQVAADMLDMSRDQVIEELKAGRFGGLCTPTGHWLMSRNVVVQKRIARNRARRG